MRYQMKKRKSKKKVFKQVKKKPASTRNGELIRDCMLAKGVKGDYKDFVMLVGARMIDWVDSWDIFKPDGTPIGIEGVLLLHKSQLHRIVDEKFAEKFWNRKLRMRIPPSQKERNPNAACRQ